MTDDGAVLANWLSRRAGRLTGSRMADAMTFKKDGSPAACRSDYMRELLAERITGLSIRHYVTDAMQWGIDHEAEAAELYEVTTGNIIEKWPGMFFTHPDIEDFGASPDGLLYRDGVAEIKCPTTQKFLAWRMAGAVPDEHKPQMIAEVACSGRRWAEFIAYDPRVQDPRLRLFVRRYEPTVEEIAKVEAAAVQFLAELNQAWELLTTTAA